MTRRKAVPHTNWGKLVREIRAGLHVCRTCGEADKDKLQGDHILAICNGGGDEPENLQPLCKKCHAQKTAKDVQNNPQAVRVRAIKSSAGMKWWKYARRKTKQA